MNIANVELNRSQLVSLLREFMEYHKSGSKTSLFSVQRYFKCAGLDVKLLLKMDVTFEATNEGNCIVVYFKITTDCVSLRRSNFFWVDKESVMVSYVLKDSEELEPQLENVSDELIQRLKYFKICSICRILYSDIRESPSQCCVNCLYDSVFHVNDSHCVICNESIQQEDQTFALTCAHLYHSSCILLHFIKNGRRECPLCRELDTHQM
jgi:hypothetical protein